MDEELCQLRDALINETGIRTCYFNYAAEWGPDGDAED